MQNIQYLRTAGIFSDLTSVVGKELSKLGSNPDSQDLDDLSKYHRNSFSKKICLMALE